MKVSVTYTEGGPHWVVRGHDGFVAVDIGFGIRPEEARRVSEAILRVCAAVEKEMRDDAS